MTLATAARAPLAGFPDPVHDAQRTFRAVLEALSRPTRPVALPVLPPAPDGLSPEAAAVLLALCDDSTRVWLAPELRATAPAWLAFHTGARITEDAAAAAFAVAAAGELPPLAGFAAGTDEAPHGSATLIVADDGTPGATFVADGPGFPEPASWTAPFLPGDFARQWARNAAAFPRGVDLLLVGEGSVTGLPRTTRLAVAGSEG